MPSTGADSWQLLSGLLPLVPGHAEGILGATGAAAVQPLPCPRTRTVRDNDLQEVKSLSSQNSFFPTIEKFTSVSLATAAGTPRSPFTAPIPETR